MPVSFDPAMFSYTEDTIQLTQYEVLGKLPDPFMKKDGTRIQKPAEWDARRRELAKDVIDLQYGTIPPAPEVFRMDTLYDGGDTSSFRLTVGTKEKQTSFMLKVLWPTVKTEGKVPVVVDGDFCFNYSHNRDFLSPMLENGIAYAIFNRTELANDVQYEGRRKGPLYDIYPTYSFGALGAWAWGYSRCVDALVQLDKVDTDWIVFTGHSRGGKTAMLAGALDSRAAIVNPNETNCGSSSCYRIHSAGLNEEGEEKRSETLRDLWNRFDFWIGEGMEQYADREADLPFDCHELKAMIAPRILLLGEAASDMWTNVPGTWQTSVAAMEVFDFLGCRDNFLWYFRNGFHKHHPEDIKMLVDTILHFRNGEPLTGRYYDVPFKRPELIFDWKKPQ